MSEVQLTKFCIKCEVEKPVSEFGKKKTARKDGLQTYCLKCRSAYAREHKQIRTGRKHSALTEHGKAYQKEYQHGYQHGYQRMRLYYMKLSDYEELLEQQQGVCAICGQSETSRNQWGAKQLAVDHNHQTGDVRGLLCFKCNTALGRFNDDPALLQKAIDYLTQ